MEEAGRVGIRVMPDTRGFPADLKEKLADIERTIKLNIPMSIEVKDEAIARAKAQIDEAFRDQSVRVDVDVDAAAAREKLKEEVAQPVKVPVTPDVEGTWRSRVSSQVKRATAGLEAVIPLTADGERMRTELRMQVAELEKMVKAKIPVEPQQAADFRAKVAEMVAEIDGRTAQIKAEIKDEAAKAQLDALTRGRTAKVKVDVDKNATSRLSELTSGIRGATAGLGGMAASISKIGVMSSAIGSLASVAIVGIGNIALLGQSVASLSGIALLAPGALLGMAAGAGVLAMAMMDVKTQLGSLAPALQQVQKSVSGAFWTQAAQPIKTMTNSLLPTFRAGLTSVGTAMGGMVATVANQLGSLSSQLQFKQMFADVAAGTHNASAGVAAFIGGFQTIASVGTTYLPAIGSAFTALGNQFKAWANAAAKSGQLKAWIDGALAGFQSLGSMVGSVIGIFGGLVSAASAAGLAGGSLGVIASGLSAVNAAINGPLGQGLLTQVFAGAATAVQALQPGIQALGQAFIQLAPALATALPQMAGLVSALVAGLAPILPTIVTALGSLAATLTPIATQLLSVLVPAINMLLPPIMQIITQLASALMPVIMALLPPLISITQTIIGALAPILTAITPLLGAIGQLFGVVGAAVAQLVAAVAPLIVALVTQLAPIVTQFVAAILPGLQAAFAQIVPAVAGLAQALIPVIALVAQQLGPTFTMAGQIISAAFAVIGTVIAVAIQVITGMVNIVTALMRGDFAGAWQAAQAMVANVTNTIKSAVSSAFSGVVNAIGAAMSNVRQKVDEGMRSMGDAITNGVNGALSTVAALPGRIGAELGRLRDIALNAGASMMRGLADGINGAVGQVTSSVQGALDRVASFFPHSPAKTGPFSGSGYTSYSGRALARDFGDAIGAESGYVAAQTASMMQQAQLSGQVSVSSATPTATSAGTSASAAGMAVAGPLVHVEHMEVRSDADIAKVSAQLQAGIEAKQRAFGSNSLVLAGGTA